MSAIRNFNVEADLPTLDEARRLAIAEINHRALKQLRSKRQTGSYHDCLLEAAQMP